MRRIGIIILSLVIVAGLGGGAYAYVAKQRQMWPFGDSTTTSMVMNNSFTELLPPSTAIYAQLDLANANVQSTLARTPELQKNINLLKNGLEQFGNSLLKNQVGMLAGDTETQQKVSSEIVNGMRYLGGRKIHIVWDIESTTIPSTTTTEELPGTTLVAIETNSAEEAKETLTTVKGFLTQDNATATVEDIQIAQLPATQITITTTSTAPDFSAPPSEFNQDDFSIPAPMMLDDSSNNSDDFTPPSFNAFPTKTVTKVTITYVLNLNNKFTVLSTNKPAIEQLVQRSLVPNASNLKNNPTFAGLASRAHGAQLATLYMDTAKYAQTAYQLSAGTDADEVSQQMMAALLQTPIYQSHSLITFTLNDKGIYSESYTSFVNPAAAALYANAGSASFAGSIPDSALYFVEGNNLSQLVSMILMPIFQSLSADPVLGAEPIAALRAFEQSSGLSLQNDVAPLFSKTTAVTLDRSNSILIPVALTLLTEVTDQSKAMTTMTKITNALVSYINETTGTPLPAPTTTNVAGVDVHSFGSLDGVETLYNYGFLKDGKSLVLSSAQSAFKKLLDTIAAPGTSLARSSKYPALLQQPAATNNVMYVDLKGMVDTFMPLIRVTMPAEIGQMYDMEVKPYIDILNNFASYGTLEGNVIKSVMQLQLVQ